MNISISRKKNAARSGKFDSEEYKTICSDLCMYREFTNMEMHAVFHIRTKLCREDTKWAPRISALFLCFMKASPLLCEGRCGIV